MYELAIEFLLSILASVITYYICKWLDKKRQQNHRR